MFRLTFLLMIRLILVGCLLVVVCWGLGQIRPTDVMPLLTRYEIDADVALVDVNRHLVVPALQIRDWERSIALSPDGRKMVYIGQPSGAAQVFVVDIYTGQTRQITDTADDKNFVVWSPDGQKIAYVALIAGAAQHNIFIADVGDGSSRQLTHNRYGGNTPTWSPDGRFIVFVSGEYTDSADLYAVDVNCVADCPNRQHHLTRLLGAELTPSWSPDGTQVAFMVISKGELGIYTVATGCLYDDGDCLNDAPRLVLKGNAIMSPLLWSGDNQRLIFQFMINGVRNLYQVEVNCVACSPAPVTNISRSFRGW